MDGGAVDRAEGASDTVADGDGDNVSAEPLTESGAGAEPLGRTGPTGPGALHPTRTTTAAASNRSGNDGLALTTCLEIDGDGH